MGATVFVQPLDLVKNRMQMSGKLFFYLINFFQYLYNFYDILFMIYCSHWLMTVFIIIREQNMICCLPSQKAEKFYKRNVKEPLVSLSSDMKMLEIEST